MADPHKEGWKHRRRFMWVVQAFCMYCIYYVMISGLDTRVNETIVMSAFLTMASILGSYVFGAAWQDINTAKRSRREHDREDS
jgi:hypothetical protein